MLYRHKYFTLDSNKRAIYSEIGNRLYIGGNAFLMLEYLCKEKQGTVDEVGACIDREAEYEHENLRQLIYKLKIAIGHNVIIYHNGVYSIDGEVIAESERKLEPEKVNEDKPINTPLAPKHFRKKTILSISAFAILILATSVFLIFNKNFNIIKPTDDMVLIPAGEFFMGSTETRAREAFKNCEEGNQCYEQDYLAEYPQRKVTVKKFFIDKKEVSNADYKLFVKATGHKSALFMDDSNLNSDNQPVVGVNWQDAGDYCRWLGKRLPTEAEWEKAARGTDGRIWPYGNTWDSKKENHGKGGLPGLDDSDGYLYTSPVGANLDVSPYGVFNMSGNVVEWVVDDFKAYPGNDKFLNDKFNGPYKIIKGGSYANGRSDNRTSSRTPMDKDYKDNDLGFRCVKD